MDFVFASSFITKNVTFVELAGVIEYDTNPKHVHFCYKEIPQNYHTLASTLIPTIFSHQKTTPELLPSSSDFCHSYPARPNKRSTMIMASGLKKLSLGALTESRGQTGGFLLVVEPTQWEKYKYSQILIISPNRGENTATRYVKLPHSGPETSIQIELGTRFCQLLFSHMKQVGRLHKNHGWQPTSPVLETRNGCNKKHD